MRPASLLARLPRQLARPLAALALAIPVVLPAQARLAANHAPGPRAATTSGWAPPASTAEAVDRVLELAGVRGREIPTIARAESWGPDYARYEREFRQWERRHFDNAVASERSNPGNPDKSIWAQQGYYDGPAIRFVAWARGGGTDDALLQRAIRGAVSYRDGYVKANGYNASAHWSQLDGLALHYLVTGDESSRYTLGRVADQLAAPYYLDHLTDLRSGEMENRQQAKVLVAFVLAAHIRAPSQVAGRDWRALATQALGRIVASQASDGAYRWQPGQRSGQCGHNKPFMVGMLNDAMIRYDALIAPDARILPAIRKSLDYMMARDLASGGRSIVYLDGQCGDDGPGAVPDLNNLLTSGFGYAYRATGDVRYRDAGDALFAGSFTTAITAAKQWNQQYTDSVRWLAYRIGTATPGAASASRAR